MMISQYPTAAKYEATMRLHGIYEYMYTIVYTYMYYNIYIYNSVYIYMYMYNNIYIYNQDDDLVCLKNERWDFISLPLEHGNHD